MRPPALPDLRTFVEQLRRAGDLVVVEAPVSADEEVAEIHRRVIAAGGPALLFEHVEGADFPLVTNLFGSAARAQRAFGDRPFQLVRRAVEVVESLAPPSLARLWAARDIGRELIRLGTRTIRSGPVARRTMNPVDLQRLPIIKSWPEDAGRFVTLPLVYTEHPRKGTPNLGMYRLQVHGPSTTGMHWQIGKGGGFHFSVAEADGVPLPVTVYLGGPPALILAAIAPLPENVPELLLASLLAGQRLRTCRGPGGVQLLADAEFALVGRVPAAVRRPEGPFGDHYGYYSLQHDFPVFEIETVVHRRDAIYPATVVGKPRQEDFYIGDLLQELLAPLFPLVMPGVIDLWSYGETGYHSLAAAVVRERYRKEAMVSAFRILGEGQLALTKFLLVVDQQVDLKCFRTLLQHVLSRTRVETDLFIFSNLAMDTLDYTGPRLNEGSKGVWLGIGDPVRDLPGEFSADEVPSGVEEIVVFCPGCLIVGGGSRRVDGDLPERIARHQAFTSWPLVVVTEEPRRAAASSINFLWTTFTRFEPAADIYSAQSTIVRNHVSHRLPIVIDARLKTGFPRELTCSPEIADRVTHRWREYFPRRVEMGDSALADLDDA